MNTHLYFIKVTTLLPVMMLRYESNSGGEREIQRTMLELLNQLDGFDSKGDVKVCMSVLNSGDLHQAEMLVIPSVH